MSQLPQKTQHRSGRLRHLQTNPGVARFKEKPKKNGAVTIRGGEGVGLASIQVNERKRKSKKRGRTRQKKRHLSNGRAKVRPGNRIL